MESVVQERLIADLKATIASLERCCDRIDRGEGAGRACADGAAADELRQRAEQLRSDAQAGLDRLRERVAAGARGALDGTRQRISDKPWQAVAVSAGAGMLAGLLIGRR